MVGRAVKLLAPHIFCQSPRASRRFKDKVHRLSHTNGSKPYRHSRLSSSSWFQDEAKNGNDNPRTTRGTVSNGPKTRRPLIDILPTPKNSLDKILAKMTVERKQWRRAADREKGELGDFDEEDEGELEEEDEGVEINEDDIRLLIEPCQVHYEKTQVAQQKNEDDVRGRELAKGSEPALSQG